MSRGGGTHSLPLDEKQEAQLRHLAHLQQLKKEHKKDMTTLRSNKLFQEFLQQANEEKKQKRMERTRKDIDEEEEEKDESHMDVIRRTAIKQGRPLCGVWSAFGQPYASMGPPNVVVKTLPPLNRDDINGVVQDAPDASPSKKAGKGKGVSFEAGKVTLLPMVEVAPEEAEKKAEAKKKSALKKKWQGEGEKEGIVGGSLSLGDEAILCWAVSLCALLHVCKGTTKTNACVAWHGGVHHAERHCIACKAATPTECPKSRCSLAQDEEEVRFPKDMLHLAAFRKRKAKSGRSFVNEAQAQREMAYFEEEEEEGDGAEATGDEESNAAPAAPNHGTSTPKSVRSNRSTRSTGGLSEADVVALEASTSRLEVGSQGDVEEGAAARSQAGSVSSRDKAQQGRPYSSRSACIRRAKEEAGNPLPVKPPNVPKPRVFRGTGKLSHYYHPPPTDYLGSSPVVRWRKEFLDVRHHMNQQLFDQLHDRAERRTVAMKSTLYTAAVAKQLMEDMRLRGGKLSSIPQEGKPDSWHRAAIAMHASDQPKKVDVAEIQAIERFYEKLCHLVERQRVSDPLSLSVVHRVKSLLEAGYNMNKPLLLRVLEHIKPIHELGGADNPYILPIMHFIRQSCRVSVEEFDHVLRQMDLQGLVVAHQQVSRGTATRMPPLPSARPKAAEPAPEPKQPSPDNAPSAPEEPADQGAKSVVPPKLDFEE